MSLTARGSEHHLPQDGPSSLVGAACSACPGAHKSSDLTNLSRSPSVLTLGLNLLSCFEEMCLFLSSACCLQPFSMTAVSCVAP